MVFKPPTVLPDYSKLTTALNASGVHKWNPELHTILKQLILATQQTQDVITGVSGGSSFNPGDLIGPQGPPGASGSVIIGDPPIGNMIFIGTSLIP